MLSAYYPDAHHDQEAQIFEKSFLKWWECNLNYLKSEQNLKTTQKLCFLLLILSKIAVVPSKI